jgi:hypothetical protein
MNIIARTLFFRFVNPSFQGDELGIFITKECFLSKEVTVYLDILEDMLNIKEALVKVDKWNRAPVHLDKKLYFGLTKDTPNAYSLSVEFPQGKKSESDLFSSSLEYAISVKDFLFSDANLTPYYLSVDIDAKYEGFFARMYIKMDEIFDKLSVNIWFPPVNSYYDKIYEERKKLWNKTNEGNYVYYGLVWREHLQCFRSLISAYIKDINKPETELYCSALKYGLSIAHYFFGRKKGGD